MAKRTGVENQFCVVPRKSIKLLGESVGINYLSSEVAASLAEDASYRIRQTVQVLQNINKSMVVIQYSAMKSHLLAKPFFYIKLTECKPVCSTQ